jgi:transcriptional regulator with XRE-family HTH domain
MSATSNLPIEPLYSIAAGMSDNPRFTQAEFARMINVTQRAINRWKSKGGIPWTSADEAAIAIGLHPMLVWGDAWLNVKGDFEKLADEAERDIERNLAIQLADEALD